ncbi:TetR/AcrR family transcriptional regulator [Gordonia humi]|uniref:AcrR family transcriptional regulator n=1 Tax=Gordonia humi TaxID=686429 RepID=A0A840EXD2_9ACTN|nr:TetR/AcrR family transcriptional regulator [Gordonia humi]MBB4136322.1 AcrR family transcriptional regulator [Gordonia humi]
MATSTGHGGHHHGNLREALIEGGIEMLEAGETFSLRAVARRAGVSQAAPYRHFADKEDLEAAMAARGFEKLQEHLAVAAANEASAEGGARLAQLTIAYVAFATQHPSLYRLMHSRAHTSDGARIPESASVFALIEEMAGREFPDVDAHGLATGGWALAHGFASLHIDGQIAVPSGTSVDDRIRAGLAALAAAS